MRAELGFDPSDGVTTADWLLTPSQRLLAVAAGDVFADPTGELTAARNALHWYPHDVWLLVMAGYWRRIAQLEHFVGRTAAVGDELGSRLVAASLVRDLIRLAFLQERRYAPYPKWLSAAFATLARPEALALAGALAADEGQARETALCEGYRLVAEAHNSLGVTDRVDPQVRPFYGRPFVVLGADRFDVALRTAVQDSELQRVDHDAGGVDAVSDSADVLTRPDVWQRLRRLYDRGESDEGARNDGM